MFEDPLEIKIPKVVSNFWLVLKKASLFDWAVGLLGLLGVVLSLGGWIHLYRASNQSALASSQVYQLGEAEGIDGEFLPAQIIVDVSGAVNQPGVYELEDGARMAEAISAAGGFTDQADAGFIAQQLNIAQVLSDAEKIYIPYLGERDLEAVAEYLTEQPVVSSERSDGEIGLISINSASLESLDTLPGIGPKRAESIIAARPYTQLKELVSKGVLSQGIYDEVFGLISL